MLTICQGTQWKFKEHQTRGEDMAAFGVEVTKRTPATGFVKIDEVEAKVRATIIVMKT